MCTFKFSRSYVKKKYKETGAINFNILSNLSNILFQYITSKEILMTYFTLTIAF